MSNAQIAIVPTFIETKDQMNTLNNNDIIIIEGMLIDVQNESNKCIMQIYVKFLSTTLTISSLDEHSLEPFIFNNTLDEAIGTF